MTRPRPTPRFSATILAVATFACYLAGSPVAPAANYFWDGTTGTPDGASEGGAGPWDKTNPYWDNNSGTNVIWTDGNTAIFGGGGGGISFGAAISALNIQFTSSNYTLSPTATNTLTLTGGFNTSGAGATLYSGGLSGTTNTVGGPLTIAATGSASTPAYFTAAAGNTLNLTGTITQTTPASSGNTIFGPGNVSYSGTGFSVGKFNVQGGAIFNTSGALTGFTNTYAGVSDTVAGTTWNVISGGTVAGSAVTLFVGSGTGTSGAFSVSGTGTATFAALNAGNTFNGGTTAGDSTGTVTVSGGGALTVNGSVRLGSTGAGVGTLNLSTNGRLILNSTTASIARGAGTAATGGSGTINFNGGAIQFNNTPAVPAIAANITTVLQNSGATINTNSFNVTVASPITHGGTAATDGGLTKSNTGILTLTAADTYTGPTAVTGGGLTINLNGGLSSSNVTLSAATTLTLAATVTAAHSAATASLTLAATSSAVVLSATTAGTVQDTVGSLVVAGVTETTAGTYGGTGSNAANILPEFSGNGVIMLTPVPEPSTWALLAGGFGSLLAMTVRRRRCK